MGKEVKVKCRDGGLVDISELKEFQGNLKTLSQTNYKKLKKEILTRGFLEPISVWNNNILNGHQRLKTLQKLKDEGYKIPKVPVNIIDADTLDDAKRIVLALTSQYGTLTEEGLHEYMLDADIPIDEIEANNVFPELDLTKFKENFLGIENDKSKDNEIPLDDRKEYLVVVQLLNETEQAKLYERLQEEGYECKLM